MTILSYGFDGSLAEKEFSQLMTMSGHPVNGSTGTTAAPGDFAMAQVTGYRSVTIAPGTSYAAGVMAVSDATETVTFPAPTTWGQWHLVVLRRDWSANTTKLVVIPSDTVSAAPTAVPAVDPVDLRNSPGIIHDHKLAWCLVYQGNTTVLPYVITHLAPWLRKTAGTSAERDLWIGSPGSLIGQNLVAGREWYNTQGEWVERYLPPRASNGQSQDVARSAGWYPVAGHMPMIEFMHDNGYNQSIPTGTSETTLLGYGNLSRNYWGSSGSGEPQVGLGYQGLGVFNIGLPGRWSYSTTVNFANTTSGTFRGIGVRSGSQGLLSFQRVNPSAAGPYLQVAGVFNIPSGGDTFWLTASQDSSNALNVHVNPTRLVYLGPN